MEQVTKVNKQPGLHVLLFHVIILFPYLSNMMLFKNSYDVYENVVNVESI